MSRFVGSLSLMLVIGFGVTGTLMLACIIEMEAPCAMPMTEEPAAASTEDCCLTCLTDTNALNIPGIPSSVESTAVPEAVRIALEPPVQPLIVWMHQPTLSYPLAPPVFILHATLLI